MTPKTRVRAADKSLLLDRVLIGDARVQANKLSPNSIDVTITSPPYFDVKDYGRQQQIGFGQSYEQYLDDLALVFAKIHTATKNTGSLWLIVDTFRKGQEVLPLPFDIAARLKNVGWVLRDIIIWKKDRTVPWIQKGATRRIFEYILVFSKTAGPFRYELDNFRDATDLKPWWVRYPERYNPKGKAPEEIWTYGIPTQGSWGDSYIRHFCPLPSDLVSRIVQITTNVGDVVLDPFAGSGTVLSVSKTLSRFFIGIELNSDYVAMFKKHLAKQLRRPSADTHPVDAKRADAFEANIASLRILKFGRLLARAIHKEFPTLDFKVFVYRTRSISNNKFKQYSAEYLIWLGQGGRAPRVIQLVEAVAAKPPLSKFGIEPTFTIAESKAAIESDRRRKPHYGYTLTNSHFTTGRISFEDAWSGSARLVSPIRVEISEPPS